MAITGYVGGSGSVSGLISGAGKISGRVRAGSGDYPLYTGPYEAEPRVDEETELATAGKRMNKNVKVLKVPLSEVENPSGGRTLVLGVIEDGLF